MGQSSILLCRGGICHTLLASGRFASSRATLPTSQFLLSSRYIHRFRVRFCQQPHTFLLQACQTLSHTAYLTMSGEPIVITGALLSRPHRPAQEARAHARAALRWNMARRTRGEISPCHTPSDRSASRLITAPRTASRMTVHNIRPNWTHVTRR